MVSGNPAGIYPQSFYGNIGSVFVSGLPAYGFDKMCHRICAVEERYVDTEYCEDGRIRIITISKNKTCQTENKVICFS